MFDPTIYDNLKVVFEGAVYDMDLSGAVKIIDRTDRVELSSMSRSFGMELVRVKDGRTQGGFLLAASIADLSAELMSDTRLQPGCSLELTFVFPIHHIERDCGAAAQMMAEIWGEEHRVEQCIITVYGQQPVQLTSKITITFSKKLDERHIDDISSLLEHLLLSMQRLDELKQDE